MGPVHHIFTIVDMVSGCVGVGVVMWMLGGYSG